MSNIKQDFIKAIHTATNRWPCEIMPYDGSIFGHPLFVVDIKFQDKDWAENAKIIIDALIEVAEDWEAGIDWNDNICSLSLTNKNKRLFE